MLSVLIMGWVHYYSVSQSIMQDVYNKQLINNLRAHQSDILVILEKALETSISLADDPALIDWFGSDNPDPKVKDIALRKMDYLHHTLGYPTIFAVSTKTKEYWHENFHLLDIVSIDDPDDKWFFETIKYPRKSTLNFDYNNVLKKSMLFINVLVGNEYDPLGVAGVGVKSSVFIEKFRENKPSENAHLWLINKDGNILLAENAEDINQSLDVLFNEEVVSAILSDSDEKIIRAVDFRKGKFELASMNVGVTDYKVVMVIPKDDLLSILDSISYNTIWSTIITLLLTLVISSILAKSITRPIVQLTRLSNKIAHAKLDIKVEERLIDRDDEIGQLAKGFDSMQKQLSLVIERLNAANADLEKEKKQLKAINIELNETIIKASESERLTKAFMANISHEIRTPMNSILGFAQLIDEEIKNESVLKNYANIIVNSGNHLLAILNNIIEVAKMDSGMVKPEFVSFSAKQVVNDTIRLFEYGIKQNVKLINQSEEQDSDDVQVYSDLMLVKRVLNNFISNAIKYTKNGEVRVAYELSATHIIFSVADTGIGINENDQLSIFKPFWQVDHNTSINDGAGLGLAISKKVVEILHGHIWLESKFNEGSVFYFSIPLNQ